MPSLAEWAKIIWADKQGQLGGQKAQALRELRRRATDVGQTFAQYIEPTLAVSSGMAGQAVGGIVGAAGLPYGVDNAANAVKRTQDWMTYVPRTEGGQKGMQKLGDVMGNLENKVNTATAIGSGLLTARATGDITKAAQVGKTVKDKGIGTAAGDFVADTTGSPALATAVSMIPEAIDAIAGTKLAGKIPGQQFEMGDIGSQQFGQRGAVSGVSKLDELKANVDAEQAKFDQLKKPLQEEFKQATDIRKDELRAEIKALRLPKDAASSRFFAEQRRQAPKSEVKASNQLPEGKPFKGVGFHQTSENFDDFDFSKSADGTTWFTTDKANFSDPSSSASAASGKGRVIERNIDLKKAAGFDEMDRFTIDELQSMGFDGAVLDGDVQIFSKSAISKPKGGTAKSEGVTLKDANKQLRGLGEGAYIDKTNEGKFATYDNSGRLGSFDTVEEALSAKVNKSTEGEYRIQHTAPVREGMNSIDDMTDVYPDDIYDSKVAGQYYGHGGDSKAMDNESARIISGFRGKPEKDITIYRAVPKGVTDINKGDWITVNKNYAKSHGDSWVDDGNFDIISKKVKAKDIATDGNSIHEFGYDPTGK